MIIKALPKWGALLYGANEESILSADATESVEDEIDDSVGEKSNDKANDSVENGVFGVGDFFAVATRKDIAKTTPDEHNDRQGTNDAESKVGKFVKNAFGANELGGHAVGTSSFSAFLGGEGHDFAGAKS